VTVKEEEVPVQVGPAKVKAGVATIVATIGMFELLVPVKAVISPVPVAARPMVVLELVQL